MKLEELYEVERSTKSSRKEEKREEVQLEVAIAREYRYCHYVSNT